MKKDKCKNCYWYRWRDSVWGYCWRFPPKEELVGIFPKIKYKMVRPEIIGDDFSCGEFKRRNNE